MRPQQPGTHSAGAHLTGSTIGLHATQRRCFLGAAEESFRKATHAFCTVQTPASNPHGQTDSCSTASEPPSKQSTSLPASCDQERTSFLTSHHAVSSSISLDPGHPRLSSSARNPSAAVRDITTKQQVAHAGCHAQVNNDCSRKDKPASCITPASCTIWWGGLVRRLRHC